MSLNKNIKLLYGKQGLSLNIKHNWNTDIIRKPIMPIIKDIATKVNNIFNAPNKSEKLINICKNSKSACILVCDITRPVPNRLFLENMIKKIEQSELIEEIY